MFIAPDGSEITLPLLDETGAKFASFLGIQTGTVRHTAKIRMYDPESLRINITNLSRWHEIARLFTFTDEEEMRLTDTVLSVAFGAAVRCLRDIEPDTPITIDTINEFIRTDMEDHQ